LEVLVLGFYFNLFPTLNLTAIVNHNKKTLCLSLALIETISFLSRFFIGIKRFSEEQEPSNQKCHLLLLLKTINEITDFEHFIQKNKPTQVVSRLILHCYLT
jgi:hypothetical protein